MSQEELVTEATQEAPHDHSSNETIRVEILYEEEELPPSVEPRKDRQLERNAFKTELQAADRNSVLANPSVRA